MGEETVGIRERIVASRHIRRGLTNVRGGLRECRGVKLELAEELSPAGCCNVQWSANLLGKGRRKGEMWYTTTISDQ